MLKRLCYCNCECNLCWPLFDSKRKGKKKTQIFSFFCICKKILSKLVNKYNTRRNFARKEIMEIYLKMNISQVKACNFTKARSL